MKEVHYLIPGKLRIVQDDKYFKFGTDSVLLANFAEIKEGDRVVDLGTGSGVISLLLAYKQKPSLVTGLEIQPELVELMERNIELNGFEDKIEIIKGDLCRVEEFIEPGSRDCVVCNPPFTPVSAGKVTENKYRAIARHEIKADLEDVIRAAACLLRFGGHFFLVHRAWRMAEAFSLLRSYDLEPKRLRIVHPRRGKPADSFLLEARRGGNPGLIVDPVLIVYAGESEEYTREVKEMYGEDLDEW
ncbi:MAG: tRNA1(Val) (adenine(37)-N6)-methyltransferase [Halanaerobiaceae bacterium]